MRVPLNRRLTLERLVQSPDGAGGFGQEWQPSGLLWADIRAGAGTLEGGVVGRLGQVAYRITVRAAPPASAARPVPGNRFREGVRIFQILAVADRDPAGRYLICFAHEEVAA